MAVANVLVSLEVRVVLVTSPYVHYLSILCEQCGIRTVDSSGNLSLYLSCFLASSDDSLVSRRIGGMPLFTRSDGKCRDRRHSTRAAWRWVRDGR
jgi:hypothetical protein